ncbi:hypothetical protein [Parasitella parasitica]|uniref:Uncharacterized protein n=1 Tax=Parasitella parasitica TaxID=35722 RepID=A0A0B7N1A1_9FUNG|nr:hypothetical protein [Parasitella parasitica]
MFSYRSNTIKNNLGEPEDLDGSAVLARVKKLNKSYKEAFEISLHTGAGTNEKGETLEANAASLSSLAIKRCYDTVSFIDANYVNQEIWKKRLMDEVLFGEAQEESQLDELAASYIKEMLELNKR